MNTTDRASSKANDWTVVIPTRLRPREVARAVRSVLQGTVAPHQVIVVNQSPDEETVRALREVADQSVCYIHTLTQGISAALNCGIRIGSTEWVAITGDDCEVAEDWIEKLRGQATNDPSTSVIFGSIRPAPHDENLGFVPSYIRGAPAVASGLSQKYRIAGTTACMALRRETWRSLGGFDETLGIGSRFGAAEDTDFTIRALSAGYKVGESPCLSVVHHGFYSWDQRPDLLDRNWYGTGAAMSKALRRWHVGFHLSLGLMALGWLRGGSQVAAGMGKGPRRRAILSAFLRGFRDGFRASLDPSTGHFERPKTHVEDESVRSLALLRRPKHTLSR